jgi:hypothetical protein
VDKEAKKKIVFEKRKNEKRAHFYRVLDMPGDPMCQLLHLPATTFSWRAATMVKFEICLFLQAMPAIVSLV